MKKFAIVLSLILCLLCTALILTACGAGDPVKVEAVSYPTDLTVQQGGVIDLSGGIVRVTYEDGSTKEVAMDKLEKRGLDVDTIGTQTLVLVYKEGDKRYSLSFDMTVVSPSVASLELMTEGVKTFYLVGDSFDKSHLRVIAHYATGTSAEVYLFTCEPSVLSLTTTSVKVRYGGKVAEIPVTVEEKHPISAKILSFPKTEYVRTDAFDPTGLTMEVTYNDDNEEVFSAGDLVYRGADGETFSKVNSLNDTLVKVVARTQWGDIEADLSLSVRELVPTSARLLSEESYPFYENDTFDFPDDLRAEITYNNGTKKTVDVNWDRFEFDEEALMLDDTSVTVRLVENGEVTLSVPVTVSEREIEGVVIRNQPTKQYYYSGESIDLAGLEVVVTLSGNWEMTLRYENDTEGHITCDTEVADADHQRIAVYYDAVPADGTIRIYLYE